MRAYDAIRPYLEDLRPGDVIIEIGSNRGENSTLFFTQLSQERNLEFHSVDIDPEVPSATETMDGLAFLKGFGKKIRLAYLDDYDWIFENDPNTEILKKRYARLGLEAGNSQSMQVHLQQAIEVERLADSPCYVLFDDTWKTKGGFGGKGGTAVPYLLSKGFRLLNGPKEEESRDSCVLLRR